MRNRNRSANVPAKLVQPERRNWFRRRIEEIFRIERGVPHEFIYRTVITIAARAERNVDNSLPSAIRRRRGTGLHFEFLNSIDRREKNEHAGVGIHTLNTVEQING